MNELTESKNNKKNETIKGNIVYNNKTIDSQTNPMSLMSISQML